jgi:translation elongation factor EF-1beta
VKPTASSVDLDALAQKIMSEVTGPAIKWIVEYKKVPVAFIIFKLVIGCIVEDTVSTESIIEQIQEMKGLLGARLLHLLPFIFRKAYYLSGPENELEERD